MKFVLVFLGKSVENVRKRTDVRLVNKWDGRYGAEAMISKPNFHSCTIFNENLFAIELEKLEVFMDKPIYVGLSVLDISKVTLHEFHNDFAKTQFDSNCKLLYTHTDSTIYEINHDDIYQVMNEHRQRFDTPDYPTDHFLHSNEFKKKLGLMKDECNGQKITEFIGLRSKVYYIEVENEEFTRKCKGVKTNVVKNTISAEDFRNCLFENNLIYREQCKIASKGHRLFTEKKIN